jgi:aminoglycoside phosphotransferase (APT) family kinase protein
VEDELRAWVEAELDGAITEAVRIGTGASREIWGVKVGAGSYVVRVDNGTGPVAGTPLSLVREAAVYRALQGTGLPIPHLFGVAPGGQALLMERVEGEEGLAAVSDDEDRAAIGRHYLELLAQLHHLEAGPVPELAGSDLDLWSTIHDERAGRWGTPSIDVALDWLRATEPAPVTMALLHGDAGPGNFLFSGAKVTALLDWEFAHIGDPHDDLAWVAVRNHLLGRPMQLDDVYDAWMSASGWPIQRELLDYYRVFVLTRMAISCDASLAWKHGVEDDSIRTQVILRPWLGAAIVTALELAGANDLAEARAEAERRTEESSHADLLRMIPDLEPFA